MPPPSPVPTVTSTMSGFCRPPPKRYSPQAAAFASFSTTTGRPTRAPTISRSGRSTMGRFGVKRSVARFSSTKPGTASPIAETSWLASSRTTASTIASSTSWAVVAGVDTRTFSTSRPEASTAPAAIFVPPTSTPIVRSTAPSCSLELSL